MTFPKAKETKSLQKASIQSPLMIRYVSDTNDYECEVDISRGPPDCVLMYLERDPSANVIYSQYPPVITGISLNFFDQEVKSVEDLNEKQLYYATKRKTNFRADVNDNRKRFGAVLLGSEDFEYWDCFQNEVGDNFRATLSVNSYKEVDDSVELSDAVKSELATESKRLHVVFFYYDYKFEGTFNNCRFWKSVQ